MDADKSTTTLLQLKSQEYIASTAEIRQLLKEIIAGFNSSDTYFEYFSKVENLLEEPHFLTFEFLEELKKIDSIDIEFLDEIESLVENEWAFDHQKTLDTVYDILMNENK